MRWLPKPYLLCFAKPSFLSPAPHCIEVPSASEGLCAHQQCHPEVVCEFTEGQDGNWPLVRGALEREGRERSGQPCPNRHSFGVAVEAQE